MLDVLHLITHYFNAIVQFLIDFEIVEGLSVFTILCILVLFSFAMKIFTKQ